MRVCLLVLLAGLCLPPLPCAAQTGTRPPGPGPILADSIRPRPDTSGARPGALRTFESDLTEPQPRDSVAYQPHRRGHHHHEDDDDDTSGLFSRLIGGIFRLAIEGYASLPNPNYGPYPYCNVSGFYTFDPGNATYLIVGAGYQHTFHAIPTACTNIKFTTAALVIDGSYQQYREFSASGTGRLHLAAIKVGARKAPGSHVLWQNHLGVCYLKGDKDLTGGLLGAEFRVFPGDKVGITCGYDIDFFPKYGTVFHDLTGTFSYFIGRVELAAGYHALIAYKGASLQGPSIGVDWHF